MRRRSRGGSGTLEWIEWILMVATLGWALGAAGCGDEPVCGDRPLDALERSCLVDEISRRVQKEYPFAELNGIDLDQWSEEVRQLPDPDVGEEAFLRRLETKVSELNDGHTNLGWAESGRGGQPPFRARMLEQGCYVTSVRETDVPLERGDRILSMGGRPVDGHFTDTYQRIQASTAGARRRVASYVMVAGVPGTSATIRVEGKGTMKVERSRPSISGAPAPHSRVFGDIGYVVPETFEYVDDIERMDRLINAMMDLDGIIFDVRGNGGGLVAVPDAVLARLFETPPGPFVMKDRDGDKRGELGPGNRGAHYDGPVAVLTDADTFSAANYFAHRIWYHRRGTIVGRRTGGGAGLPNPTVELADGVFFRVSGDVVRTPAGDHTEKGVPPDIEVPLTPEILEATPEQTKGDPDRDRSLRRALEHLRSTSD